MGKITLIPCDWRRWGQRQAELRDEDKVSGGAARAIWAQWPAARATGQGKWWVMETQMSVLTMSEHYEPCEHSRADWE